MRYTIRVRGDADPLDEHFEDVEEAHSRFSELALDRPEDRLSLYGPGGVLLRRRPYRPAHCYFCDDPAPGSWPVTRYGTDKNTRFHDFIPLCPGHHTALTANEYGYATDTWLWRPGHLVQ